MKDSNSIFDQVKERMQHLDKTTPEPKWERIANTLQKNKRRRYAAWILSGIGTALIILFFVNQFVMGTQSSLTNPDQNASNNAKTQSVTTPNSTTNNQQSVTTNTSQSEDSSTITVTGNDLFPDLINTDSNNAVNTATSTNRTKNNKNTGGTLDSVEFFEGSQSKTTYYYYNDKNNTQIVTQDKSILDSLINSSSQRKIKDSIN